MGRPVSEMVERVARQLYCAQEGVDLASNSAHLDYWFGTDCEAEGNVSISPEYRRMAIAAIKAMRDATPEMILAGSSGGDWPWSGNTWNDMIDAALGDTNAA